MSNNIPAGRKLTIKRKRDEAPVDALMVEQSSQRRKLTTETTFFRRVISINASSSPIISAPSDASAPRRFHITPGKGRLILVERKEDGALGTPTVVPNESVVAQPEHQDAPASVPEPQSAPKPRKLPGMFEANKQARARGETLAPSRVVPTSEEPSEEAVREAEKFAEEVERKETVAFTPTIVKMHGKYKPKAPALRFKDRHPNLAKAQAAEETAMKAAREAANKAPKDEDAMDVDEDIYVYDTYVQDDVMTSVDGVIPQIHGSVGVVVFTNEEDEERFEEYMNGVGDSEEEYYTDDEDSNAEDWHGADYPEDEMDPDDEFDANPYKYAHGSDEEEYDAVNDVWSDEDEAVEALKYPWKKMSQKRTNVDSDADEDYEEDEDMDG
ncbi:hypothetical protein GQ43DRAFT_434617 [Delitschia confertaspora ATCC 74209]|uniref:Transcription factor Iwr1 domain-containing protein n=1 Tax=Delitschia confertaspora ATCC 74209 TaxID=1513339 RepID=A0A9P4MPL0_9PLEO|nr:hypothetical protein GQ43DRAFT_434617 [Delitschia confertaspora ATCC 74209]